jgi:hypothetical protein
MPNWKAATGSMVGSTQGRLTLKLIRFYLVVFDPMEVENYLDSLPKPQILPQRH